jgi:hypothetical protein
MLYNINMAEQTEKKIDYLDEDPVIKGQEWICVSFLSPEKVKGCKTMGFKFRGAFPTQEEANAHAKYLQDKIDPDFHIFVGSGFKWLPFNPDPESIETQEYYEKELNNLMKSVKEELASKKQHERERVAQKKAEMEARGRNSKESGKTRERLQKKLYQKKKDTEQKDESVKGKEPMTEVKVEDGEKIIAKKEETEKILDDKKKEIGEINDGVRKLQEVYAKLLDKSNKDKLKNNM